MSNGLDSVTEVEIFCFAEQFLSRGMATFLFDGPGQGINIGCNPLEIEFELVVRDIVNILRDEPYINVNNLGFFGISFGGYFALRVAQHLGKLFKCVINLSGGPYLSSFNSMPRRLKEDFKYAFMEKDNEKMQSIFDKLSLSMTSDCQTDILSIHGALDDIFPVEGIKKINFALGDRHRLIVYDSESHVCLNYINQYSVEIGDWVSSKMDAPRLM